MRIVLDKMVIPDVSYVVRRERLLALVNASVQRQRATLVCGRAGCGKTILAAQVAAEWRDAVAWLKLDAADVDIQSFLGHLVASIVMAGGEVEAPNLEPASEPPTPRAAAETLVAPYYAESPGTTFVDGSDRPQLVLVVDGLDHLYDAGWFEPFFSHLLAVLPRGLHLFATCRALPPLPLWRLRSKQALEVVDEATLGFTEPEARALLAAYDADEILARKVVALGDARASVVDAAVRHAATRTACERSLADRVIGARRHVHPSLV
jgi:LuxR family maltose regulon positive regulatory protein